MGETRAQIGLLALFGRSLKPMLLADDTRKFVDANRAATLLLRLPRAEILARRIEDILAPPQSDSIELDWETFLAEGERTGRMRLAADPPCERVEVLYTATANVRPGLHLGTLALADADDPPPRRGEEDEEPSLTERERQVLRLLALGLDGPQIALELSISNPTVQTHVRNAMGRLGAHTRAHAVALALASGELGL